VITSLESKLSQLLSQANSSVLEWNALATEAVVVLIEHEVLTLQSQQLTVETTVVHSTTLAYGAEALFFSQFHEFLV